MLHSNVWSNALWSGLSTARNKARSEERTGLVIRMNAYAFESIRAMNQSFPFNSRGAVLEDVFTQLV